MMSNDLAKAIKASIAHGLKALEFKRNGRNSFSRQSEDVIQFVEFQKSMKTTSLCLTFTINLGVYSQRLSRERQKPEVACCHWSVRLGELLPTPDDRWWDAASDEDARRASEEVLSLLTSYGLPALQEVSSTAKLKQLWLTNQSPGITDFSRQEFLKQLENI
jgi:hypothetical protein